MEIQTPIGKIKALPQQAEHIAALSALALQEAIREGVRRGRLSQQEKEQHGNSRSISSSRNRGLHSPIQLDGDGENEKEYRGTMARLDLRDSVSLFQTFTGGPGLHRDYPFRD